MENITVRRLETSDADDFMALTSDEKVTKACSFEPCKSAEQALEYITRSAISHPFFRAICLDNQLIGSVSVTPKDEEQYRGEIGYILGSDHWGKGIGTKAVELAISSVLKEWPTLGRLEAVCDVDNVSSQRVLEKVGFMKEGLLRKYVVKDESPKDVVLYSFLSTDLIKSNA